MLQRPPSSVESSASERLDSWKEIGAYLKRDVRTVRRWEREGLPVYRHVHAKKATVYAYKSEVEAWWTSGARARLESPGAAARRYSGSLRWVAAGFTLVAAATVAINLAWVHDHWRAIASEIRAKLTPQEKARLAKTRRVDPQAYEAYVKGLFFMETVTQEGIAKGIQHFSRAIDIDPTYAPAYAGLADAYNRAAIHDYQPAREAYPAAKLALSRALQLDDTLAEAHVLQGVIKFRFDWDWAGAERDLKSGLALDPNNSRGHLGYSTYLLAMGRIDDALRVARRNVELDPLTILRRTDLAWKLSYARRYDEAIAQLKKAQEIAPDSGEIYGGLGVNYGGKRMPAEALAMCDKALAKHVGSFAISECGRIYLQSGKRRKALDLLKHLLAQDAVSQYQVARLYDALGDQEQAVQWLLRAYEARAAEMCFLRIDTVSEALRSDPRFQALLLKMNFPSKGLAP
jgi:tetratricopeptide (TPR) repeat protein